MPLKGLKLQAKLALVVLAESDADLSLGPDPHGEHILTEGLPRWPHDFPRLQREAEVVPRTGHAQRPAGFGRGPRARELRMSRGILDVDDAARREVAAGVRAQALDREDPRAAAEESDSAPFTVTARPPWVRRPRRSPACARRRARQGESTARPDRRRRRRRSTGPCAAPLPARGGRRARAAGERAGACDPARAIHAGELPPAPRRRRCGRIGGQRILQFVQPDACAEEEQLAVLRVLP